MKEVKREKITEILRELAAEFIRNEATSSSLITVTRAEMNQSGKDAIIYFTTLPESEEEAALKFLERKTNEFKHFVRSESRLGLIPFLRFKIDYGERNRQHLDTLSVE